MIHDALKSIMMKWLVCFILIMLLLVFAGCNDNTVVYSNRSVTDVDISELVQDNWFDYSYFWQAGKDENGKDLTLVTIYWTTVDGYQYREKYVTDGKTWERVIE